MDPNVAEIINLHMQRAEMGLRKYGRTTEGYSELEMLIHARDEAMDLAVYLTQAIRRLQEK